MPRRRAGHTTEVTIGGEQFWLVANAGTDGSLGEVFIRWGKHGSGAAGLMDLYGSALSMALQHGIPLADLIRTSLSLRFAPDGRTDDPDIPQVGSVADYVARRLAIDWLPVDERASLGVYTRAERLGLAQRWPSGLLPAGALPDRPVPGSAKNADALVKQGAEVVGVQG
jgi:ribonucleoside-diphosphate reductase alpha chain